MSLKKMLKMLNPWSKASSEALPALRSDVTTRILGLLSELEKGDAPAVPEDAAPTLLPPSRVFKKGTPVRLNKEGVRYMRQKLGAQTRGASGLALMHSPFHGYVREMLPGSIWNVWDADQEIGSGPSDVGDCLVLCPAPADRQTIWEVFIKYSGYLEEVPLEELSHDSTYNSMQYLDFPASKQLARGDRVAIDDSLLGHPLAHLRWPAAPRHGVVEDVFPVQYISTTGGSWDGPVRVYDCIVGLIVPGTGNQHFFHHYSGWLKQG